MDIVSEMCWVVGILIVTLILWYTWRFVNWGWFEPKRKEKCLRDQGLKGTSYKFLFGDMKEMLHSITQATSKPINLTDDIVPRVLPFVDKSVTTYGKLCFTWMGNKPMVQVCEPSIIQEIFTNYYQFQKPRAVNELLKSLGGGIFHTETHQWVKHRKILNPAFHVQKLKNMVLPISVSCSEMIRKWEDIFSQERSCELDVWPHLHSFASDVISRTAFGSSFEEGQKIFELLQEQTDLFIKGSQSIYIPGSRFLPTRSNKRIKYVLRELNNLVRKVIDKRVIMMKSMNIRNEDLLGILLDSNYKEIFDNHGNNNFGLTIDEVIKEVKLFYFAGQETTASMLLWTMILLSQYTEWQERARKEVSELFGDKIPDIEGLSRLKVVNMILNEVLRLYPPAVSLGRIVHEEMKLGSITLPADTYVQVNILHLHRDYDIWGDDAKVFNPERFSEGVSKATKGHYASFIPFGGGPRICIGQNFAMLEAKMAIVMILQRFSFELSPSYMHAPHNIIILQPQFGAHLILHKL